MVHCVSIRQTQSKKVLDTTLIKFITWYVHLRARAGRIDYFTFCLKSRPDEATWTLTYQCQKGPSIQWRQRSVGATCVEQVYKKSFLLAASYRSLGPIPYTANNRQNWRRERIFHEGLTLRPFFARFSPIASLLKLHSTRYNCNYFPKGVALTLSREHNFFSHFRGSRGLGLFLLLRSP